MNANERITKEKCAKQQEKMQNSRKRCKTAGKDVKQQKKDVKQQAFLHWKYPALLNIFQLAKQSTANNLR